MFNSNDIIQHTRLKRLSVMYSYKFVLKCNRTNMGSETMCSPSHKVTFNKNNHYILISFDMTFMV